MFAKMKTGTKVLAGFGFAIAITLVVGCVGYRGISKLSATSRTSAGSDLPSIAG